ILSCPQRGMIKLAIRAAAGRARVSPWPCMKDKINALRLFYHIRSGPAIYTFFSSNNVLDNILTSNESIWYDN
ncbi:hypothetical protein, partial [Anaerotruncus colihominis]|uniref:hypothetical protein n=1 Tax=Anaerotruncus colihominis TaxID=169435 RepID=UPI0026EEA9B0